MKIKLIKEIEDHQYQVKNSKKMKKYIRIERVKTIKRINQETETRL